MCIRQGYAHGQDASSHNGFQPARSMADPTTFRTFSVEGLECLEVQSDPQLKTFIPFGIDGITGIITPYGDLLRIARYYPEHFEGVCIQPRAPDFHWELQRLSQSRGTGYGLYITPSKGKLPDDIPRLVWVNDRWPRLTWNVAGVDVSVQFIVKDKVLVQQYVLTNNTDEAKEVCLQLRYEDVSVRHLVPENESWRWMFKFRNQEVEHYAEGHMAIRKETLPEPTPNALETKMRLYPAILELPELSCHLFESAISVFHNGEAVNLLKSPPTLFSKFDFAPRNEAPLKLEIAPKDSHEITIQHKISLCLADDESVKLDGFDDVDKLGGKQATNGDLTTEGTDTAIPMDFIDIGTFLSTDWPGYHSLKSDQRINTMLRRHLEHALCLCAIPVTIGAESGFAFNYDCTMTFPSVPEVDFDMFHLLLLMHRHASQNSENSPQKTHLIQRIEKVCKGYVKWAFDSKVIFSEISYPLRLDRSSSDKHIKIASGRATQSASPEEPDFKGIVGSLRFILLYSYLREIKQEKECIEEYLIKAIEAAKLWLQALADTRGEKSQLWFNKTDKTYITWEGQGPRDSISEWLDLPEYRLGHHCYVWKALQVVEWFAECSYTNAEAAESIKSMLTRWKLQPDEVRELILQRFLRQDSEKHPVDGLGPLPSNTSPAQQRPFLLTFSCSRQADRRLLRDHDSTFYDGLCWGFVVDDYNVTTRDQDDNPVVVNVKNALIRTFQAQEIDHEDTWESPTRYMNALALRTPTLSLSSDRSEEQLRAIYYDAALKGILPNGMFQGRIYWDTKLPNFDLQSPTPYGSWRVALLALRMTYPELEKAFFCPTEELPQEKRLLANNHLDPTGNVKFVPDRPKLTSFSSSLSEEQMLARRKKVRNEKLRWMAPTKFDASHIYDPKERKAREWLYPPPAFLSPRKPYLIEDEIDQLDKWFEELDKKSKDDALLELLRRGMNKYKDNDEFDICNWSAVVVDIKHRQRHEPSIDNEDAEDLDKHLSEVRNIQKAKKRFIYMKPLEAEHALIVYLSSPTRERQNMLTFYSRHKSGAIHLHESVHSLADSWITEFHISFIRIIEIPKNDYQNEKYGLFDTDWLCNGFRHKYADLIADTYHAIFTSTLSYRFVGDMTDRFWTGTLLAYLPGISNNFDRPAHLDDKWFAEAARHDQRRVLEPFIVQKMVAEAYQSTDQILSIIEIWLDPRQGPQKRSKKRYSAKETTNDDELQNRQGSTTESSTSAGILNEMKDFDSLYKRSALCLDINTLLNTVLRLAKDNNEVLKHWMDRESHRGNEKPRWTRKDEQKCGELIDHEKRQVQQQYDLLCGQCERIGVLLIRIKDHRQFLVDKIQLLESRTAALNAENVRIFTYATVIFLPLSFVSSLYSMQALPSSDTITLFIRSVVVALVVTLLLVFNADALAWLIRTIRYIITQAARKRMILTSNNWPVKWRHIFDDIVEAEKHEIVLDNGRPKAPRSKMVYLLFLVIYFVVEFPASGIITTFHHVRDVDWRSPIQLVTALFWILISIPLLPVFLVVWILIAIWENVMIVGMEAVKLPFRLYYSSISRDEREARKAAEEEVQEMIKNEELEKEKKKMTGKNKKDAEEDARKESMQTNLPEKPSFQEAKAPQQPRERPSDWDDRVAEKTEEKRKRKEKQMQDDVARLITSQPRLKWTQQPRNIGDESSEPRNSVDSDLDFVLTRRTIARRVPGGSPLTRPEAVPGIEEKTQQPKDGNWWRRVMAPVLPGVKVGGVDEEAAKGK